MERIEVKWNDAKNLLCEADVLLFRGSGFYSGWLKWAGHGDYTHAGLVSRTFDRISCCEYREFKGGRCVSLRHEINSMPGEIDVFRLCKNITLPAYRAETGKIEYDTKEYSHLLKSEITKEMFNLTGNEYSWWRIWRLAKYHIPILRWFQKTSTEDNAQNPEEASMVCSTAVAYCFRTNGIDLVPNLSDFETVPSDLARSSLLTYLFTLVP